MLLIGGSLTRTEQRLLSSYLPPTFQFSLYGISLRDRPEAVVVGALQVVEKKLATFIKLVALKIELIEEVLLEGNV